MICVVCKKNNEKSKLYPIKIINEPETNLLFYDEDGSFHDHTSINNLVKEYYKCSNGHNFYTCLRPRYNCCESNDTIEIIVY